MKRAFFAWAIAAAAFAETTVSVVSVSQDAESGKVAISYTLAGDPAIVTVDVRTNGVSIGAKHLQYVWGDVNRIVAPNAGLSIGWDARRDWPGQTVAADGLSAVVTAWPTNSPPDYMEIDMARTKKLAFYPCEDAVPGGVTDKIYKTERLLMRRIPAKNVVWRMGSPSGEAGRSNREATHLVKLSHDYYLGVYPVTQKQMEFFVKAINLSLSHSDFDIAPVFTVAAGYADGDLRPCGGVCYSKLRGEKRKGGPAGNNFNWLWPQDGHSVTNNSIIGRLRAFTGVYLDLPTEAQWEYACRAGDPGAYTLSGADLDEVAWHIGNSAVDGVAQTHPVGLKKPNGWGLYDMLGNVMEWCLDNWGYYNSADAVVPVVDPATPIVDPVGIWAVSSTTADNNRVRRGGDYGFNGNDASYCRAAAEWHTYSVDCKDCNIGFRLCCPAAVFTED